MSSFKIFISHAASDRELALAVQQLLANSLGLTSAAIFVSSDSASLRLGNFDIPQIIDAHEQSRAVVAIITPNSVLRPWVMSETGGATFSAKPLFVVLAGGISPDSLPSPLKIWHCGHLGDRQCIESLCRSLKKLVGSTHLKIDSREAGRLVKQANRTAGDWSSVKSALVVENWGNSPFSFTNILQTELPQAAKSELYIVGPTLNVITQKAEEAKNKAKLFAWLMQNKARECRMMICDNDNRRAIGQWTTIFPEEFKRHLPHSTSVLRRWAKEAKTLGLRFQAYVTPVVPVSATFVDAKNTRFSYMVLTPVVYKVISIERPHFIVTRREQKSVFEYYWHAYWQQLLEKSREL